MCNGKTKSCKDCLTANCLNVQPNTAVPATLAEQVAKAEGFLDLFGQHAVYKHRGRNPYLKWLRSGPKLAPNVMYRFFNFWQPVRDFNVAALVGKQRDSKRSDRKPWMRFFSAKRLSIVILAMALLKALVELTSAIVSLF